MTYQIMKPDNLIYFTSLLCCVEIKSFVIHY